MLHLRVFQFGQSGLCRSALKLNEYCQLTACRSIATKKKYNKAPPIDLKAVRTRGAAEDEKTHKSSFGLTALALLSIPVLTFGLGVWQIKRREWKLDLIKHLESRTTIEPRQLPKNADELENLIETSEFCPFKVRGHFIHEKEILISPKHDLTGTLSMPGGLVVTPFVDSLSGLTILVNRGFVPYTNYSPMTRLSAQVQDEVELTGLLRSNEITSAFTPDNKPPNEWHYRDLNTMSKTLGTAPIFIDALNSTTVKGGPIGGQTAIKLRNEHTTYIVTWFTLSFLTSILWWRRFGRVIV